MTHIPSFAGIAILPILFETILLVTSFTGVARNTNLGREKLALSILVVLQAKESEEL